jgi:hypothetical protein
MTKLKIVATTQDPNTKPALIQAEAINAPRLTFATSKRK